MKLTIHQPNYFPWLGLIHKISLADTLVILDDVQANKASNQYRNQFYCNGEAKYITLPVNYSNNIKINQLEFKNNLWRADHLNKLNNYYQKTLNFKNIFPEIEEIFFNEEIEKPIDLLIASTCYLLNKMNIKSTIILSSSLNTIEAKGDLVLEICKKTNTNKYISGLGAKAYLTENQLNDFRNNNIEISWQDFKHPIYTQQKNKDFVSGLSALDFLFWETEENVKQIFNNGNE